MGLWCICLRLDRYTPLKNVQLGASGITIARKAKTMPKLEPFGVSFGVAVCDRAVGRQPCILQICKGDYLALPAPLGLELLRYSLAAYVNFPGFVASTKRPVLVTQDKGCHRHPPITGLGM